MPDAIVRQARVGGSDLSSLIEELYAVPGGPAESPFAADAAVTLEKAIVNAGAEASTGTEIPDGQAEAISWALERMMLDKGELSAGLHDLRGVVAP